MSFISSFFPLSFNTFGNIIYLKIAIAIGHIDKKRLREDYQRLAREGIVVTLIEKMLWGIFSSSKFKPLAVQNVLL